MTAQSQKEKEPAYCQEAFDSHVMDKGDVMERLREQWIALSQLEWPLTLANHEALRKAAEAVDANLMRFAISQLRSQLEEAAVRDTSRLIAELVFDTTEGQEALKRLEGWLDAAPCWPVLAKENWAEAVRQAARVVVDTLTESGVQIDTKTQATLADQVGRLELKDLLPQATIGRLFPATQEPREW